MTIQGNCKLAEVGLADVEDADVVIGHSPRDGRGVAVTRRPAWSAVVLMRRTYVARRPR